MNAGWRVYCMCQKYFRSQLVFICYVHTFTNSSSFWGANTSHFCHLYKRILHFILDPTNSWSILDQMIACCLFGGMFFKQSSIALYRHVFSFLDLRLNKRLSKQSWGWWFETPSRPLWHHCNVTGCQPLPEPMNMYCQQNPYWQISVKFEWKHSQFPPNK